MRVGRGPAATAAVLALALGVTACGGGSDKPKGPSPAQDRAAVRGTLLKLEQATAAHDYAAMCNQVLARTLVQRVAGAGLPCETALSLGLGRVHQPRLQVATIKVTGNRALAQVYSGAATRRPRPTSCSSCARAAPGGWPRWPARSRRRRPERPVDTP